MANDVLSVEVGMWRNIRIASGWQRIRFRVESNVINTVFFGTLISLGASFLYKGFPIIQSESSSQYIKTDALVASTIILCFAAFCRYASQFMFVLTCPSLIQSNRDLDELLKKTRDILIDENEWPSVVDEQTEIWMHKNYQNKIARGVIIVFEVIGFFSLLSGSLIFVLAVREFLSASLRI